MARPKKISRQLILEEAWRQLDVAGPRELSMRGLAAELGVEAMSLYRHVGRREDLLSHLRTQLYQAIEFPQPGGSPRRELEEICWAVYRGLSEARGAAQLLLPQSAAVDAVPESGVRRDWESVAPHLEVWQRMLVPLRSLIPESLDRAYALRVLFDFVVGQVIVQGTSVGAGLGALSDASLERFSEVREIRAEFEASVPEIRFELSLRTLLDAIEGRRGF